MKKPYLTAFLILLFFAGFAQPDKLNEALNEFLQQQDYEIATTGIHVMDIQSGHSLFEFNADKLMIPASTLKLVTSGAALELLGGDYRFKTRIGYSGTITNDILTGDLVVAGGGDPSLGSEYFEDYYFEPDFIETWVGEISAAGIKEIHGNLIFDLSLYDSETNPPTWVWEDIGNYYGSGSSALTVFDNLFRISFRSPRVAGKPTTITDVSPQIKGMNLENEVVSSDIYYDQAYVFGSPLDNNRVIRGEIPKNRRKFTIKAAVPQPEKVLAEKLVKTLAKSGIFISGDVKFEKKKPVVFNTIYIQQSPPLAEIVKVVNHESVNLFAEHLVRQIAAEATGTGSRKRGIELIKEFWELHGINKETWFMEDGSGLSHFNAISPKHFTRLLQFMYTKSQSKNAFLNSLASPGEGTLVYWDQNKFPDEELKAKSGSMTRVRCYAGYLESDSGKNLAFSFMLNHFAGGHAQAINEIERLLYELKEMY